MDPAHRESAWINLFSTSSDIAAALLLSVSVTGMNIIPYPAITIFVASAMLFAFQVLIVRARQNPSAGLFLNPKAAGLLLLLLPCGAFFSAAMAGSTSLTAAALLILAVCFTEFWLRENPIAEGIGKGIIRGLNLLLGFSAVPEIILIKNPLPVSLCLAGYICIFSLMTSEKSEKRLITVHPLLLILLLIWAAASFLFGGFQLIGWIIIVLLTALMFLSVWMKIESESFYLIGSSGIFAVNAAVAGADGNIVFTLIVLSMIIPWLLFNHMLREKPSELPVAGRIQ